MPENEITQMEAISTGIALAVAMLDEMIHIYQLSVHITVDDTDHVGLTFHALHNGADLHSDTLSLAGTIEAIPWHHQVPN